MHYYATVIDSYSKVIRSVLNITLYLNISMEEIQL